MMKSLFFFPLLALSVLFAGCTGPESPQEVSEAFWQAVLKADANDASEYSTLVDEAAFDSFERNWDNVQVEWGRVVIDDHLATVATTLSGVQGREEALETVTYLVQKNGDWLVDYYRTGDALKTDPDRKSTRLNSSHVRISYAVFCLKKKKKKQKPSHCKKMRN